MRHAGEHRCVIVTIAARNYLEHARVLMEPARHWAPGMLRVVIGVDREEAFSSQSEDFFTNSAGRSGNSRLALFHFKYAMRELATAVKRYALGFLFHRYEVDRLVYLDPNIQLPAPWSPVLERLDSANLLLTPHLTGEVDDGFPVPQPGRGVGTTYGMPRAG